MRPIYFFNEPERSLLLRLTKIKKICNEYDSGELLDNIGHELLACLAQTSVSFCHVYCHLNAIDLCACQKNDKERQCWKKDTREGGGGAHSIVEVWLFRLLQNDSQLPWKLYHSPLSNRLFQQPDGESQSWVKCFMPEIINAQRWTKMVLWQKL